MMKNVNIRTVIASVLMLTVGFVFGASGVSALTAEGESLFSNLAAAGSLTGIEVLNKTTTSVPQYSDGAEADLAEFLKKINFDYDEFRIIDLTDYVINRNGTFEEWIQNNYGADIQVPASVRLMSPSDLVIFLMSNKFNPEYTVATTTGYVFDDSDDETTLADEKNSDYGEDESFSYEDTSEDMSENQPKLLKGDVNSDGFITAADARLALRASAKLIILGSEQNFVADVTGDNSVTAKDARMILRYSAKLIVNF